MLELVRCKQCGYKYEIYPAIPATSDSCPNCESTDYKLIKNIQLRVSVDVDTYKGLWEIAKRRFRLPSKKLATIIREALKQYVKRELRGLSNEDTTPH